MLYFNVSTACINPTSRIILFILLMVDYVYNTDIHSGAKEATNAKEAGHAGIENGLNVRTDNNLVGEHQIRNADQYGE